MGKKSRFDTFFGRCFSFSKPEKRGRKPGSNLNGDRRVESMGGIAAGAWWGHRGSRRGDARKKEGMCRKKERREEVWERSGRMKRA